MKRILKYLTHQIIPSGLNTVMYPYLDKYYAHTGQFDNYFKKLYGYLALDDMLEGEDDDHTIANINAMVKDTLMVNNENLVKLWNLDNTDYNPLWNVEGTEKHTYTFGEQLTTDNYGSQSSTSNIGARHNTNVNGGGTSTTENGVTGYNSNSYQANDKTTNVMPTLTNTASSDTATDTVTNNAYVDTHKNNSHVDTDLFERGMNLGMMSTQDLFNQEITLRQWNFYEMLFKLIFSSITIPMYID